MSSSPPRPVPLPAFWNTPRWRGALLPALLLGPALLFPASAQSAPTPSTPAKTTPASTEARPAPPFTLSDALAGLSTSAQYRQAQLALSTAQAQLQAAQASVGPTAGVNGSLSLGSGSSTATDGTTTSSTALSVTAGASVSLPVLPWSAANLAAQSAARAYAVARATFAQTSAALTASAEQAFGRAVTAQLNLSIARSSLTLAQRQLAQLQAFQAVGNATTQSVQSGQAAVQDAQTALLRAQAELDSARRALGTLTGNDLSAATFNPDVTPAVSALATLPAVSATLTAARAFSPALASAQKNVTDAQASIDSARRARDLPAASLSASYGPGSGTGRSGLSASLNLNSGVASASYTQPFTLGSSSTGSGTSFALGLTASFNILDPGADGTLKLADLQLQQAQAALTVQGQTVDQNALDAYNAAQIAAQATLARQTSVTAYTTALATVQTRFEVGLSTETDVLNAQIALAQAVRDLNTAQISALTSAAQLAALTGPLPGP